MFLFILGSTYLNLIHTEYCAPKTCYEVLNVNRSADKKAIKKAFYKLAASAHPDINRDPNSVELFFPISKAYEATVYVTSFLGELLSDDYLFILMNQRAEYDMYLEFYENKLKRDYFKQKIRDIFDIKNVLLMLLLLISGLQWYLTNYRHTQALEQHICTPRYRNNVQLLFDQAHRLQLKQYLKDHPAKRPDQLPSIPLTDDIVKEYVESCPEFYLKYPKASWKTTLLAQIFIFPLNLLIECLTYSNHMIKFYILRMPLSRRDQVYFTRRILKITKEAFEAMSTEDQEYYISLELWIDENATSYFESLKIQERKRMANSGKAKAYMRFMKNGGYGRMTFDD
ncbi:DnaJ subfamily C member 25 [Thelohanellus kitauei]|uniref:DnaJ subfamily C member 25 n=1 Tax=Thelohanellus kitauei TaxID=669202 RepID=A0A0C2N3P6_THEKT|nr:DnaJ subfamily C member 25 [Thelohanellus kitauei]